ncbi:MAG TPA: ASKHA domain-containing protein [Sedimentisphaerales bacterium]|nr:ASKHA domain-containing protein [Sedimentisphaerales bacterium]HRS10970.1 ASKHA domain-containing protein [Sedimentisphaerales bacterium]HRV48664.1 ASKHA domain-containing protein [Sedimentisphaerales bacterium]
MGATGSMKHFRVIFEPDGKEISIHQGATLVEAAGQAGIVLNTSCGGRGTCGKCVVRLGPSGQEVLACQYTVHRDLTVTVPASSRFYAHKVLEHGLDRTAGLQRTVVERYRSMAGTGDIYGLAVDIGTTTVVAKLVDLANGQCIATRAMLNPQTQFGDDVVSRISYAESQAGLDRLHAIIIDGINQLIRELCAAVRIEPDAIYEASVVGNTTMNHIFLRFPVAQLGQAPYRAHSVDAHDVSPVSLELTMNPAGNVHTVENIAGFVGSDTTAVALAVDIGSATEMTLVVDIGTNGELLLGTAERLYAASCAAGPALEGARIRCGSRAVDGAIEAVIIDRDDIVLDVIGGGPPLSICGSGLIDAVAVLLELGVVETGGHFADFEEIRAKCSAAVASRCIEVDGQPAFCLARSRRSSEPTVVLTQRDIREFQLAKGAIQAGIRLLLGRMDIDVDDLQRVLLAGAFGNYIRPASAVRVGLLPNVPLERIHFVGNAAVSGAQMLLISDECRAAAAVLTRRIQYVEIANEKAFSEVFADSMLLRP